MTVRALLIFVLCCVLTACAPAGSPSAPPPSVPPAQPATSVPQPTTFTSGSDLLYTGPIKAIAWVTDPTPPVGSRIAIRGTLVGSGLIFRQMMYATWPEEGGVASCSNMVSYGSGKCPIEVVGFPIGQSVPVTVTIEHAGLEYTTHISFTPR